MSKFLIGQAIKYVPKYTVQEIDIKPGDIVFFLGEMIPIYGHIIVTTYEGKVLTMLHKSDFVAAEEEDV